METDFMPALVIAGRMLLGGAFLFAGVRNLRNLPALKQVIAARGVPLPGIVLACGVTLQLVAGAMLMAGLWTGYAALALIAFLLAATPMFHNFWDCQGLERGAKLNGVVANTALAGSFLLVLAQG